MSLLSLPTYKYYGSHETARILGFPSVTMLCAELHARVCYVRCVGNAQSPWAGDGPLVRHKTGVVRSTPGRGVDANGDGPNLAADR